MNKKLAIVLTSITILITIIATSGITYAYLSVSKTQTNPNQLNSTCFNVTFTETEGSTITLNNQNGNYAFPMSETSASKLKPYHFTITNTCSATNASQDTKYVITLSPLTTKNGLTPYLDFKLGEDSAQELTKTEYDGLPSTITAGQGFAGTYLLKEGTLAPGASVSYDLRLWIRENACNGSDCESKVMGKDFEGRIIVYSTVDSN